MATQARQSRFSSYLRDMRNIFIFKRRPIILMQKEWVRPAEDQYHLELHYQGFVSPTHWEEDDLTQYPIIIQDISDLEEHLMPTFWKFNHLAKYYQNRFYLYQWVFMFGAFLTTILAIFANAFDGSQSQILGSFTTVQWFGLLTAIVSAITSYFTFISSQADPRKRWANYRRLTEELRMTYFKYMARLEPFDRSNRLTKLREQVHEIKERERTNG